MRIEHSDLLSWVHERGDARKHKNHAQDCEMLTSMRGQHPAILPWFLCLGWRPSFRVARAPARFAQRPDCCWTMLRMTASKSPDRVSRSCENARKQARVTYNINDECYAFPAMPCNAPRLSS